MSTNSTLGVRAMQRHQNYWFRDGTVTFAVENVEFRLHRHFFERESNYFSNLLAPSSAAEDAANNQYKINDVTSDEFADLVWVWYNPRYTYSKQDKNKWLTILKLANLWGFCEIRKLAIRQLEKAAFDPVEKIVTYRQPEYNVENELLFPSYVTLCASPTLPSLRDGERLTLDTILRLARAREQILFRAAECGCRTPTMTEAPNDIVKAVVSELFANLTLHLTNDQHVIVEGQATNNGNTSGDRVDPNVVTVKPPNPKQGAKTNGVQEPSASGQASASVTTNVNKKGKQKAATGKFADQS